MGDDHDGRSLSESENLMKDDDVHTSRDDSLTKQRVLQGKQSNQSNMFA